MAWEKKSPTNVFKVVACDVADVKVYDGTNQSTGKPYRIVTRYFDIVPNADHDAEVETVPVKSNEREGKCYVRNIVEGDVIHVAKDKEFRGVMQYELVSVDGKDDPNEFKPKAGGGYGGGGSKFSQEEQRCRLVGTLFSYCKDVEIHNSGITKKPVLMNDILRKTEALFPHMMKLSGLKTNAAPAAAPASATPAPAGKKASASAPVPRDAGDIDTDGPREDLPF